MKLELLVRGFLFQDDPLTFLWAIQQIQAQDMIPIPVRADCSEGGIPAFLRSQAVDRNLITEFVSKLLKCLEKTFMSMVKIVSSLVTGFMSCIPKFPAQFLPCIGKLDLPNKISDAVSIITTTVRCVVG